MKVKFFTVGELSKYINVKPKTLYFWVAKKSIPFYRIEGCIRFRKSEIEDWLLKCSMKNK